MRSAWYHHGVLVARKLFVWIVLISIVLGLLLDGAKGAVERAAGLRAASGPWGCIRDSLRAARPHLIAAATARFASISACYPLDTIKTRLQMGSLAAAGRVQGRLSSLYLGLGGSLLGQVPYGTLSFGTYEMYKASLLTRFPEVPRVMAYCVAACLGDMTGNLWLVPFEVVKVQMQGGAHASIAKATLSIFRNSGLVGFYQGFGGQVVRDVPFRCIQLTTYELLRTAVTTRMGKTNNARAADFDSKMKLSLLARTLGRRGGENSVGGDDKALSVSAAEAAVLGGVAGAISAVITCPLDVIRTRLMAGAPAASGVEGGFVAQSWAGAISQGGLFAGIGTRIFYIAASGATFFVVYEAMKTRLVLAGPAVPKSKDLHA